MYDGKVGYQESYIYANNDEDFEGIISLVKENLVEWRRKKMISFGGIMTLKEDICGTLAVMRNPESNYSFTVGKKFIHIQGERYFQMSIERLFGRDMSIMNVLPCECIYYPQGIRGSKRKIDCDYDQYERKEKRYSLAYSKETNRVIEIVWDEKQSYATNDPCIGVIRDVFSSEITYVVREKGLHIQPEDFQF